jgi:hypothetical protein
MKRNAGHVRYYPRSYPFLIQLAEVYRDPYDLALDSRLNPEKKRKLLERWREERARYLYEYGRDKDYVHDREMQQVERCLSRLQQRKLIRH